MGVKFSKESTVKQHKVQGKCYFYCSIPLSVAVDALGLARDVKGQKLVWQIDKGKVVVAKK